MEERKNVLILCTRNSARSQIAEALLKSKVGERFSVHSAGLAPGRVHPLVPIVMDELGIDVSEQRSKSVKEFLGRMTAHYLIIVCANAEEHCPRMFPGVGDRLFWPFDDPAAVEGCDDDRLEAFRSVRDQIDAKLTAWVETLETME
jgi:arsenate reductase